jgi:large subunit ribosomal protein L23
MLNWADVLIKPLLTEKITSLTERGNIYAFQVSLKANKHRIKKTIETLFDVRVVAVNTIIEHGRLKRIKSGFKKIQPVKKAYIKIKEGQKIELFKGV